MRVVISRDPPTAQRPACTVGRMYAVSREFFTLERPWAPDPTHIGGTPGRSCVPAGTYALECHNSEAHPNSFALVNPRLGVSHWDAPGMRSLVLIHVANRVEELRGCIALGTERHPFSDTEFMLLRSKMAVLLFYQLLPWINGHTLDIIQEQTQ